MKSLFGFKPEDLITSMHWTFGCTSRERAGFEFSKSTDNKWVLYTKLAKLMRGEE